jgi:meso-butanediol dehydrogenase / (S,S)-butanediol dehydrogenase / diacetyl reductase
MKLSGKVAIVTGAAAGIGAASAELFAQEGAAVVVTDIDAAGAERSASTIQRQGGKAVALAGDVSRSADAQRVIDAAIASFGHIDILFNNAGLVPVGRVDATTEEQWDTAMAVNVKSIYLFSHAVVPRFQQQGGGVILNTASATALRAVPDRACYTATKAAVVGLTKAMALDYVRENIRVNCLCPGTVDTPSLGKRIAAFDDPVAARERFIARQPMGRFGTSEEIAAAALYLVSPDSAFITGAAFAIDGGFSI